MPTQIFFPKKKKNIDEQDNVLHFERNGTELRNAADMLLKARIHFLFIITSTYYSPTRQAQSKIFILQLRKRIHTILQVMLILGKYSVNAFWQSCAGPLLISYCFVFNYCIGILLACFYYSSQKILNLVWWWNVRSPKEWAVIIFILHNCL